MLKVPADDGPVTSQKWVDFSAVIYRILDSKSHADLEGVLRDALQAYIPHEALIAAWGNFRLGVIHYDFLATNPELHAEGVEAGPLAPGLAMFFQQWVSLGRKPMRVGADLLKDFWLTRPSPAWGVWIRFFCMAFKIDGGVTIAFMHFSAGRMRNHQTLTQRRESSCRFSMRRCVSLSYRHGWPLPRFPCPLRLSRRLMA
jgi:hypothetical protein